MRSTAVVESAADPDVSELEVMKPSPSTPRLIHAPTPFASKNKPYRPRMEFSRTTRVKAESIVKRRESGPVDFDEHVLGWLSLRFGS